MAIESINLNEMDIGKLRQYASHLHLAVPKTATKKDIIDLINQKVQGRAIPVLADKDTELKPGYSKIRVLSDPMPGASNLPVFLNANGYTCMIPRDKDVIVPNRVVRVLNDATVMRRKQTLVADANGRETFKETTVQVPSYPFMVLESKDGPEVHTNLELSKQKTMGPKRRYREMFGHWPRPRELTRAIEQGLIKLDVNETLPAASEKLLNTDELIG
jgi:hypothetical protein